MFTTNKLLTKFYTNSFITVKCNIQDLADTSHKRVIPFKPLFEGLSKVTSSA